MPPKSEAKEPKEAAPASPAAATPEPASFAGKLKVWLPAVLAVLLTPAATWAVAEYVLLPRLEKRLSAVEPGEGAAPAPAGPDGQAPAGKDGAAADTYEFSNVVVNLSGTMGTRYLKVSFLVTGAQPGTVKPAFESNKAKLTDVTLSVLSSLSLADLEEPGAKNILREKLVAAYNQALGKRVADQVYFSDFVVQ